MKRKHIHTEARKGFKVVAYEYGDLDYRLFVEANGQERFAGGVSSGEGNDVMPSYHDARRTSKELADFLAWFHKATADTP